MTLFYLVPKNSVGVGDLNKLRTQSLTVSHSIGAIQSEVFISNQKFDVNFLNQQLFNDRNKMAFAVEKVFLICVVMCCAYTSVLCQEQDALTDVNG